VIAQGGLDCAGHRFGRARLADLHDRPQRVRLRAQESALEAGQAVARGVAHGEHSTRGRAASRLALASLALVGFFGVACQTTAPPPPMPFAPTPRPAALSVPRPPAAVRMEVPSDPAPLLDPAPPENASLLYARAVLEKRGEKLAAVQREGIARALVLAEADEGLPVLMTLAMITQESRFDPRARGPSGSLGLMQLQPGTARDVARRHGLAWQSERTLLDPVQNVRIGLAYLTELRQRFGSTDHALAAYNIGPGNLSRLLQQRPLRHGPYLKKIHAHADSIEAEFGQPETAIGG
jgi:soluble lytic murein transglycosylase-like protein